MEMEMEIATGCWRQKLEPFPARSEPLPTPSSLLESLGLSPMCKMTVRGKGKGIWSRGEQDLNSPAMGLGRNPKYAGKKHQFLLIPL